MCSSPHWQVGQSWFREKLSPANREQRLSRWADFAKNCLPRIGSKVLPRFREKYRALGRQKMGSNMRPRYIQFRDIHDRDISGLHCKYLLKHIEAFSQTVFYESTPMRFIATNGGWPQIGTHAFCNTPAVTKLDKQILQSSQMWRFEGQ